MTIWSGPVQVLADGEVTTFGRRGLYIELPQPEATYAVAVTFRDDPAIDGPSVITTPYPPTGTRFDLVNFDDRPGRGSAEPVWLADVGDDSLYWHFRVFRYGRTDSWTVHYTFYRVKVADLQTPNPGAP